MMATRINSVKPAGFGSILRTLRTARRQSIEATAAVEARSDDAPVVRLPWTLIVAALICNAGLFYYTRSSPIILGLALALTLTRFIDIRLPELTIVPWLLRISAYFVIYVEMPKSYTGRISLLDPAIIGIMGTVWAVEVVVQAWKKRPAGSPVGSSIILFTALEFCAAASVDEGAYFAINGNYVMYLVPIYLLLILISLRTLETSQRDSRHNDSSSNPAARRGSALPMRAFACALALAAGFACWLPMHLYRQTLSNWANGIDSVPPPQAPEAAGLSTSPALGSMQDSQGSDQRVLRLANYHGDAHLQGAAFDTYSNGSWTPSVDLRQFRTITPRELHSADAGQRARVTCFVTGLHEIVAPINVTGVSAEDDIDRSTDSGVVLQTSAPAPYYYDLIQSNDATHQGEMTTPLTPAERKLCLEVPKEISPEVRLLAARIWADAQNHVYAPRFAKPSSFFTEMEALNAVRPSTPVDERALAHTPSGRESETPVDPPARALLPSTPGDERALVHTSRTEPGPESRTEAEAKIDAVANYLISNYSYSLSYNPGPGDPVSDFLLHQRASYCEYFASAAAILLRCLGVPTRYVTGYYAHENDGDATVVRQRDAHAWTECWVDGVGWVTTDATPGDGLPSNLYHTIPLLTRVKELISDMFAGLINIAAHFTLKQIGLGVTAVICLSYVVSWVVRRHQTINARRRAFVYDPADAALRDAERRFEAYLAANGVPCPPSRPWQEHIAALHDASPPKIESPIMNGKDPHGGLRPTTPGDERSRAVTLGKESCTLSPLLAEGWGEVASESAFVSKAPLPASGRGRGEGPRGIIIVPSGKEAVGAQQIDFSASAEFVRYYNALRFGRTLDADRLAEASRLLTELERRRT